MVRLSLRDSPSLIVLPPNRPATQNSGKAGHPRPALVATAAELLGARDTADRERLAQMLLGRIQLLEVPLRVSQAVERRRPVRVIRSQCLLPDGCRLPEHRDCGAY